MNSLIECMFRWKAIMKNKLKTFYSCNKYEFRTDCKKTKCSFCSSCYMCFTFAYVVLVIVHNSIISATCTQVHTFIISPRSDLLSDIALYIISFVCFRMRSHVLQRVYVRNKVHCLQYCNRIIN